MLGVAADSFNYGRRDDVMRNIVSTMVSISRGRRSEVRNLSARRGENPVLGLEKLNSPQA